MEFFRWLSRASALRARIETNKFPEYFCNKIISVNRWFRYATRQKAARGYSTTDFV